jgi:hypothetical protein
MLSALGPSFATSFSTTWSALGHAIGPYILLTVGLVLAVVVVSFVLHFLKVEAARAGYVSDRDSYDADASGDYDAAYEENAYRSWGDAFSKAIGGK